MCSVVLVEGEEFKRLLPEPKPEDYARLEETILRGGNRAPIVVWGNIIIDGHSRYRIYRKHKLKFEIEHMRFSSREEAIRWVCCSQIGNRGLTPELFRYQIGTRYRVEKMMQSRGCRVASAAEIGKAYGVSTFAVRSYEKIAAAIDTIAEKDPRLSERYLSGGVRIAMDNLAVIAGMPKGQIRTLTNFLIRHKKTACLSQDIMESLSDPDQELRAQGIKELRRAAALCIRPSVKDMPKHDPDGEIAGLTLRNLKEIT